MEQILGRRPSTWVMLIFEIFGPVYLYDRENVTDQADLDV